MLSRFLPTESLLLHVRTKVSFRCARSTIFSTALILATKLLVTPVKSSRSSQKCLEKDPTLTSIRFSLRSWSLVLCQCLSATKVKHVRAVDRMQEPSALRNPRILTQGFECLEQFLKDSTEPSGLHASPQRLPTNVAEHQRDTLTRGSALSCKTSLPEMRGNHPEITV